MTSDGDVGTSGDESWTPSPIQIAIIYALFGVGALLFSDGVLPLFVRSDETLHRYQTLKGGIEVALTAGLVYVLTRQSRQSLERTNSQLTETRTRLTVLYRILRHNLRTELTLIRGFAERAREKATGPAVAEPCADTIDVADELANRVDKLRSFRDVIRQETSPEPVHLSALIDRAVSRIDGRHDHHASFETTGLDGLAVRAVPEIEHAVTEVLENAVLHSDRDAPAIQIHASRVADAIELEIRDDGPGIPRAEAAVVENRQVETALEHASGIGLWLVDWTVVESGGELSITDRDPRGSTVRMVLPAADG